MSDNKRPSTYLQWKGTDVCMDVYCVCGEQYHLDGYFAYYSQCPHCKAYYKHPENIPITLATPETDPRLAELLKDGACVMVGFDD